jgi:hypothetical protein
MKEMFSVIQFINTYCVVHFSKLITFCEREQRLRASEKLREMKENRHTCVGDWE